MKTPPPAPVSCTRLSPRHRRGGRAFVPLLALAAAPFLLATLSLQAQDAPPEPMPGSPEAAAAAEADAAAPEETFNPPEYSADRYTKIRGKSPFEFELAQPKVGETVDPFADFVLAGFAGSATRPTVYLLNTKTQERLTVLADGVGKKNESGFRIISVNRGRTLTTTTAKIEKDGQQKDLAFDSKALSNMSGGAGGGGGVAAPGGRPGAPGAPMQGGVARPIPGQPQPPRPAVQAFATPQANINFPNRNAAQAPQAAQAQPGGMQLGMQPGGTDAQQQLNTLLNNNNQGIPQPTAAPAITPQQPQGNSGNPPPRRRVVLPTPAP